MATNTIIQYLETSAYPADQRDGSSEAVGIEASNRRQIETFISGAAIAANDLVALDFSQTADAVAKGDRLSISAVAGQADTYVNSDTVPIIAYACEDDTANVASVFVIKQF